jgi:pyridoxine 5-phosphate synthase
MPELGVNIDHVATVRQARRTTEPDPVWAAVQAELGGADGITIHLREDRRHIQDRDLSVLRSTIASRLNLELACEDDVLRIACDHAPHQVTLVPEKREELTTEGGLDVVGQRDRVAKACRQLANSGISVSLFIDPEPEQISASTDLGVAAVELHTGCYADATGEMRKRELEKLQRAGEQVVEAGLTLHAGHGLTYQNVMPIAEIPHMHELNIGHSIIARALMVGMKDAVAAMRELIR